MLSLILRSYSTCGVGYGSERCVELLRTHRSLSRYTELTLKECEFDVRGIYFSEKSWDPNFMD
ncbi:hypothetical protein LEP1GSC074_0108 [Leptospira noguchii str. Hook]|nr:hypothetical protein LEP1GSC074_0108 [Leptospira noguchii str. Hook]